MGKAIYPMRVVSDLMDVHPETVRVWERTELVKPARRNGQRLYSDEDIARLRFIKGLLEKGLNLAGVRAIIELYPCWNMEGCPKCAHTAEQQGCAKPCWKEPNTYCRVCFVEPALCADCEHCK